LQQEWQHFCLQHFGWQQVGLQHFCLQQDLQHEGALQPLLQPQLGAAAAQQGFAAQQVGAAALQPQAGAAGAAAAVQQLFATQPLLLQPHPFDPSIRSSKSNAKLWVQRPRPSTNDPTIMFHFIVPRLLKYGGTNTGLSVRFDRRELSYP
jgi:hypothetical protein